MNESFFRQLFQPENKGKRNRLAAAFFLGILLLVGSKGLFSQKEAPEQPPVQTVTVQEEKDIQQEMEEILSTVAGAGKVRVMVTYRSGAEQVLATEERREESSKTTEESIQTERTVVLADNGDGQSPIVLTEQSPVVEGVVIVAEGGEDPVVCGRLTEAAQALLDIPSHKIAVLKMKQGGEG
ncbi:hypothetical protein H9X85_00375 [Anaerotignum lactatifermentans]|uniref:Stage III sporulation protein AG n=1 Tax=Anaerotignum lactatifermentans TaxID=160404 RepID=A0ABS2G6F9_9FIRM|nr:hypothetical protein [Anaerotignum lactatifermentans]MBM6828082.1 hypothetical protein [Anaerotignum lactatifermentans]MBM6876755.1 hypothetical protein [Anaerotignum lactatifermentans]MBM6949665.1 hypothetical protein [Anaerotignum lactatifermentans]